MTKKEAIINTATRLFAEKGYKDTSMAEVASLTGVAQGTIFYHFKNKEELFLSILKNFEHSIVEEFEDHLRENTFRNGMEMVESVLSFYFYIAGLMEDRFLILHRRDAYELARTNPLFREHLEAIYTCLVDIFEKAILMGLEDKTIRDISPKKGALIIFSMVDGLARLNTYNLYDPGGLYEDLLDACRKILRNSDHSKQEEYAD